jgi:hypothetical protein
MQLKRWGANRNSGDTKLFDKKAITTWSAAKGQLTMTVSRVTHADKGQFNYSVELSIEDIQQVLAALSKECRLPAIATGLAPSLRDLMRLQLAAAGHPPPV